MSGGREDGASLVGILLVAVLAFLVWKLAPIVTARPEPTNKQAPSSLTLEGVPRIRPGSTSTYFVDLRYREPLDSSTVHRVVVRISADPFGDLLQEAQVVVQNGSRGGTASFALSCEDAGGGNYVLLGSDGSSRSDGVWELAGRVPDQRTSNRFEGGTGFTVTCGN